MKQKNGFTLIELLAVIVILAIIALIATPIVLDIINDTKTSSQFRSAEFYLSAAEQAIEMQMLDDSTFIPDSCQIDSDGNLLCNGETVEVSVKGEVPSGGTVDFEKGKITKVILMFDDKIIEKQDEELVYLESGLYDEEGNLIASWEELVEAKIILEKDYADEEGNPIVEFSEAPGLILSNNPRLQKGTRLVIDSSVKKLGNGAFGMNTSLKEVIIPNSVTSIGVYTFYECTNLEKIIIPNSVTSIGRHAFYNCTSLEKITIPNSVTSIGRSAFNRCANLKEVVIGNSVTNIGEYAFYRCTNLEKIIIPNSVTSIENDAFMNCENLKEAVIGNSVTNIGESAFNGCTNLKEVVIGNSVTNIGKYAFYNCKNLNNINYKGTEEEWSSIVFGEIWDYNTPSNKVINYNYAG